MTAFSEEILNYFDRWLRRHRFLRAWFWAQVGLVSGLGAALLLALPAIEAKVLTSERISLSDRRVFRYWHTTWGTIRLLMAPPTAEDRPGFRPEFWIRRTAEHFAGASQYVHQSISRRLH